MFNKRRHQLEHDSIFFIYILFSFIVENFMVKINQNSVKWHLVQPTMKHILIFVIKWKFWLRLKVQRIRRMNPILMMIKCLRFYTFHYFSSFTSLHFHITKFVCRHIFRSSHLFTFSHCNIITFLDHIFRPHFPHNLMLSHFRIITLLLLLNFYLFIIFNWSHFHIFTSSFFSTSHLLPHIFQSHFRVIQFWCTHITFSLY